MASPPSPPAPDYRLFSWEHSYFSGKVRAFLRYKAHAGALRFEDVLATPELISGLLIPATGTNAVPQLLARDGTWTQDSSEILDAVERAHPEPRVFPDPARAPRQRLACHLIELLADEWMLVYAFWERWRWSRDGARPSHARFNEQQWGAVIAPGAGGVERRAAARVFFERAFGIHEPDAAPRGVYAGLVALGVTPRTEKAWEASHARLMERLEAHFAVHDFALGGLPSLADFALLGPLYAHVYRDAVAGFELRSRWPLVAEWVERANGEGALNARSYGQRLYRLGSDGALVGAPATSDGGAWLPDDAIALTLVPVLEVFFEEMWPVLDDAIEVVRRHLASGAHAPGGELPGKSFTASPGFEPLQTGGGALTHEFELGGVRERRMIVPYQIWMLQRLAAVLRECTATPPTRARVEAFLAGFPSGPRLLELDARLSAFRIHKRGGRLFSAAP
jgi:glutathione S-transferase